MKGCDYDYRWKLYEMHRAIDQKLIGEPEKVDMFRKTLYEKLAMALAIAFGCMAAVSGVIGAINLIVCIGNGVLHVLGALAWMSVTVGLVFLSMISKTASDVM